MKIALQLPPSIRHFVTAISASIAATVSFAADQTITGNLAVTGTMDIDGNSLALGTQSSSPGLLLTYADASSDTLTFYLNRNPGSFLWAHTSAIAAMRLTANHEIILYKADGSTAGLTLTPATNTISLGATILYRDSTTGALRTNGALTVDGAFSAPSFVTSSGTVTGSTSGLVLVAGGTNQNVTITPSGTGYTVLNGRVGIGTATPVSKLEVWGLANQTMRLLTAGNPGIVGVLQLESAANQGANRGVKQTFFVPNGGNLAGRHGGEIAVANTSGVGGGTYMAFSVENTSGSVSERLRIDQSGNVGIGTATPSSTERLEVNGNTKVVGKLSASTGRFDGAVRLAPQGDLSMGTFVVEP